MSTAIVGGRVQRIKNDVSVAQQLVIYPRLGNPMDDVRPPQGKGLIFSGGHGHVHAAYRWAHDRITGSKGDVVGGDVVIIRATLDNSYSSQFMRAAKFNSAQTLAIPPDATPEELAQAAEIVSKAEFVFFSGGQQSRYLQWRDTPLSRAVQNTYDRGGVVGGTSAGLAILGECVLGGGAPSRQLTTEALVKNPTPGADSLQRGLFDFLPVYAESHFHQRDRFGRLAVLLAEMKERIPFAVAADERTAVTVDDRAHARVLRSARGGGDGYVVKVTGSGPQGIETEVHRLHRHDDVFDFKQPDATSGYDVTVSSGEKRYSQDPYKRPLPKSSDSKAD